MAIDYASTKAGDILRVTGAGAPGFANVGDLVRVTKVFHNSVFVEDRDGKVCEFVFNCGAARLAVTEWKNDFPAIEKQGRDTVRTTVTGVPMHDIHAAARDHLELLDPDASPLSWEFLSGLLEHYAQADPHFALKSTHRHHFTKEGATHV